MSNGADDPSSIPFFVPGISKHLPDELDKRFSECYISESAANVKSETLRASSEILNLQSDQDQVNLVLVV